LVKMFETLLRTVFSLIDSRAAMRWLDWPWAIRSW